MTVYESLVNWLNAILTDPQNGFNFDAIIIDLEMIPNWQDSMNAGLFSSPNDIHTSLMAGQVRHTEFKSFYLRLPFKEHNERLSNEAFFEKFRKCIYEKNVEGFLPSDGRDWHEISCGGIYPAQRQEDNQYADYLIALKLIFIE